MLEFSRMLIAILFFKATLMALACSVIGLAFEHNGYGSEIPNGLMLLSACFLFLVLFPQAISALYSRMLAMLGIFHFIPTRSSAHAFGSSPTLFWIPLQLVWGATLLIPTSTSPLGPSCAGYLAHALLSLF